MYGDPDRSGREQDNELSQRVENWLRGTEERLLSRSSGFDVSTSTVCPACDDFTCAQNGPEGWYQKDWRLMLDPTVEWIRCPHCQSPPKPLLRVQECLSQLRSAILTEITVLEQRGDWNRGSWQCYPAWKFSDKLAIVAETMQQPHSWLLVSESGVMKGLDGADCRYHIERMGLPSIDIA